MPFARRLAVGDTWYVCVQTVTGAHGRCEEAEILHLSDHTVLLLMKLCEEPPYKLRMKLDAVEFVEFVKSPESPRVTVIKANP
jgi:hypothetical protein